MLKFKQYCIGFHYTKYVIIYRVIITFVFESTRLIKVLCKWVGITQEVELPFVFLREIPALSSRRLKEPRSLYNLLVGKLVNRTTKLFCTSVDHKKSQGRT